MKSYEELANELLERREQYIVEQKKKRKRVIGVVGLICCSAAILSGLYMWQGIESENTSPETTKDDGVYAAGDDNNGNDTLCGEYWIVDTDNSNTQSGNECESIDFDEFPFNNSTNKDNVGDTIGMVVVDGVVYEQFAVDTESFTLDTYLGAAHDYEGTYKKYYINNKDVEGKLYTTKEDPEVLIVKLSNGGVVALKKEK